VREDRQQTLRRRLAIVGVVVATALGGTGAVADTGVTIDPAVNDFVLDEGETWSEELTVTVPADTSAPLGDVYLLADTTGSMGGPISAVKAGAGVIIDDLIDAVPDSDLRFGVGDFKDFPGDPYAFRHAVSITGDTTAVKTGIDAWSASGGNDGPEGQFYAYDQIASNRAPSNDGSAAGSIGWRPGSARILVVFADAPAHDPVCQAITAAVDGHGVDYDITEASVTAKMASAGITFIGVSTLTGFAGGMDADPGGAGDYTAACGAETSGTADQATRLAAATGGVHQIGIDNASIVEVIADEVLAAARTITSLTVEATGDTAQFVASIDPASGVGPFTTEEERTFGFNVDWEGVVAATADDQVFTGALDVVADGTVVASKAVTIRLPGTDTLPDTDEPDTDEPDTDDPDTDDPDTDRRPVGPGTSTLPQAETAVPVRARPTFTG
jgi:hypothetical protein